MTGISTFIIAKKRPNDFCLISYFRLNLATFPAKHCYFLRIIHHPLISFEIDDDQNLNLFNQPLKK